MAIYPALLLHHRIMSLSHVIKSRHQVTSSIHVTTSWHYFTSSSEWRTWKRKLEAEAAKNSDTYRWRMRLEVEAEAVGAAKNLLLPDTLVIIRRHLII